MIVATEVEQGRFWCLTREQSSAVPIIDTTIINSENQGAPNHTKRATTGIATVALTILIGISTN